MALKVIPREELAAIVFSIGTQTTLLGAIEVAPCPASALVSNGIAVGYATALKEAQIISDEECAALVERANVALHAQMAKAGFWPEKNASGALH